MTHEEANELMSCFTGIYPLDQSKEGQEAIQKALANPEKYVMKPQREGGGNNTYGVDIPPRIREMTKEELSAYILMERICPPPYRNALVRQGKMTEENVICELGIYGIWLR